MNHELLVNSEELRLLALRDYGVLDSEPEEGFDDITVLAAKICETPFAAVTIVDEKRLWFKSKFGFEKTEIPRPNSFCERTIEQNDLFVVADASRDETFQHHPSVIEENGLRFYAGFPLINPEGFTLGTLSVLDTVPHELSDHQKKSLVALAHQVETQLELRRKVIALEMIVGQLENYSEELLETQERYRSVVDNLKEVIYQTDAKGRWLFLNPAWEEINGFTIEESLGENFLDYVHPEDRKLIFEYLKPLFKRQKEYCRHEIRYLSKDGGVRWMEVFVRLTLDDEGEMIGSSGTLNDVTERKLAENALKTETSYVSLLQSATAAANEAETTEEAMQICLDKICGLNNWSFGHVYKIKNRAEIRIFPTEIRYLGGEDLPEQLITARERREFIPAEGLPGRAFEEKKAVWRTDLSVSDYLLKTDLEAPADIFSGFAFPVLVGAEVIAVLEFFTSKTIEPDEKFVNVMMNIGMQLGRIVERKRTTEKNHKLIRELADFKFALDASSIVAMTDHRGKITYVNDKFCEISGYSRGELIGEDHRIINSGYHSKEFIAELWRKISTGEVWKGEVKNRHKDGSFYWVDTTIVPLLNEIGSPYQYIVIRTDITERKMAEENLRESEGRFRAISEMSPLGIFLAEASGKCQYVNQTLEQICGYSADELVGWGWVKSYYPEDLERIKGEWEAIGRDREFVHEYRLRCKDEGHRWLKSHSAPVIIRNEIAGFVSLIEDVTESKEMEQALLESEARYRVVAETASDAILTIDEESRILFVNSAAEQIFGYTREEMENQYLTMLMPPSMQQTHVGSLARYIKTGEKRITWRGIEVPALRKDGREITIEMSFGEYKEEGNHIFTGIIRDVTERKRIAAELQRAKEDAEAATRAKSQFLANMSHEIRTPMNSIIGLTELMLEDEMPAQHRDLLETVNSSAESLLTIINDILDFSKIEAGKMELEILEFDLRRTIKDVVNLFAGQSLKGNNRFSCTMAPELPEFVCGDAVRLRQILTNLVGNAVKFTSNGQIKIDVSLEKQTPEAEIVRFEVSDTGIGISGEQSEQLFKAFSQADGSIKRRFGGTGLGLAITKQLVELMNGEIIVDSALGEGSTFSFTAEFGKSEKHLETDAQTEHKSVETVAAQSGEAASRPAKLKILVADDNAVNRKVALLMLGRLGYQATTACNGLEVLEALRRSPYDVVFMDVQMPEMDGLEATRRIRLEWEAEARPRIVAMTANAMRGDRELCLEAGMDDYLSKPIRKDDVQMVLEKYLKKTDPAEVSAPESVFSEIPTFDSQTIDELHEFAPEDAEEIIGELITIFLEDSAKCFADLEKAAAQRNAVAVKTDAHSLKGICATMGAARAAALSGAIEQKALDSAPEEIARLIAETAAELKKVGAILEAKLAAV